MSTRAQAASQRVLTVTRSYLAWGSTGGQNQKVPLPSCAGDPLEREPDRQVRAARLPGVGPRLHQGLLPVAESQPPVRPHPVRDAGEHGAVRRQRADGEQRAGDSGHDGRGVEFHRAGLEGAD
jgi:hypothetical protein